MFRTPSATTSPCTSTSSGCRRRRVGSGSLTTRCVHHIIIYLCFQILSMMVMLDIRNFTRGSSKDGGEGQKRAGSPRPPAPAAPVPGPGSGETLVKLVIGFLFQIFLFHLGLLFIILSGFWKKLTTLTERDTKTKTCRKTSPSIREAFNKKNHFLIDIRQ